MICKLGLLVVAILYVVYQRFESQLISAEEQKLVETTLTKAKPMAFVSTKNPIDAKKYYGEVLGLEFLGDEQFALLFRVGKDQTLRVSKVRELQTQPFTVCGWEVADIGKSVKELTARGVKFESFGFPNQDKTGICTFENGDKVAWFKDPDKNTLSIAQLVK